MKSYFFNFILWQLWSVAASYVFMDESMALFAIFFFFIVDLMCFGIYIIRRRKGVNVAAFIKTNFDVLPYKWFWRLGLVGAISMMHWKEYYLLCGFLWMTLLVAFVVDAINRYGEWKKQSGKVG